MDVIATTTGVPVDDQDRVRGWADDLIARDDKQHDLSERNIGGFINMAQNFEAHSAQHANGPLGNDLLGTMLRAEKDGVLQHAQVVGTLILLALAGNETPTKQIAHMTYPLCQNPRQTQPHDHT